MSVDFDVMFPLTTVDLPGTFLKMYRELSDRGYSFNRQLGIALRESGEEKDLELFDLSQDQLAAELAQADRVWLNPNKVFHMDVHLVFELNHLCCGLTI